MTPYLMLVPSQKHGAVASLPQVAYVALHSTVDVGHVLFINGTRSAHPLKTAHKAKHVLPSLVLRL